MSEKQIKHPSFGYATQDEIDTIQRMGVGPERDRLIAIVQKNKKLKKKK